MIPAPKKGFTLVELLVVVTIITIITGIGMVVYSEGRKGARDLRRKQDLRAIQAALTIYYQGNGRYPCSANSWKQSTTDNWLTDRGPNCDDASITQFDTNYISTLPRDPQQTTGSIWSTKEYSYAFWSGDVSSYSGCPKSNQFSKAQYYVLAAKLENASDPEAAIKKTYNFCNNQTILTALSISGDTGSLFFITSQD